VKHFFHEVKYKNYLKYSNSSLQFLWFLFTVCNTSNGKLNKKIKAQANNQTNKEKNKTKQNKNNQQII